MEEETSKYGEEEVNAPTMDQVDDSIVNFQNHVKAIKIDWSKFLVWKHQIIKILCSLDLEQYLTSDGPSMILKKGEINLAYKVWYKHDLMTGY